jgi:hypothetical protein
MRKGWNPMPNKMPDDAALQTTKQMLDELDALMEKMLTLPVNDLDEAPAFPPPIVKEPALSATLTLLEPSEPASKKPAHKPSQQSPEAEGLSAPLPFNPPHFSIESVPADESESLREETPEPEPLTNEVMPASVLPKLEPLMKEIVEPSASSLGTQWLYAPLVWVNLGFDGVTLAFGGAGTWMRSDGGRMLLGLLGLALSAAAVVWFLKDWLGWNW